MAVTLGEGGHVLLDDVVQQGMIVLGLNHQLGALVRLDWWVFGRTRPVRHNQADRGLSSTTGIEQDITYCQRQARLDRILQVFVVLQCIRRDFGSVQKVLQEESLNDSEDTTWPTLVLEESILDLLIEEEALLPRIVKMALALLEEQVHDSHALFASDLLLLGVHVHSLPDALVDIHARRLVQVAPQCLLPHILVLHEV